MLFERESDLKNCFLKERYGMLKNYGFEDIWLKKLWKNFIYEYVKRKYISFVLIWCLFLGNGNFRFWFFRVFN